jgi:hypothetical protein
MRIRGFSSFPLALALSLAAGSAQAAPRGHHPPAKEYPADVETAEQLYGKLDYENANKVATRVLDKHGLTHDELVRTLRVLAITHAVLDRGELARDAFVQLLTYAPDETVDTNLGPKVTGPFYEARGFWRSQSGRPGIELSTTVTAGAPGQLKVTLRDALHVTKKITAGYRWGSEGPFTEVNVDLPATSAPVSVSVPAPPPNVARLDSYVQARDDHDDIIFESGSPAAPKSTTVEAPPPMLAQTTVTHDREHKGGSFIGSAPFWITVGVVVAGGAVLTYVLARPHDQSAPTDAMITPALNCGTGIKCQ